MSNSGSVGQFVDMLCGQSGVVTACQIQGDEMIYVAGQSSEQVVVSFSVSPGTGTVTLEGLAMGGYDAGSYVVTAPAPSYGVNVVPNGGIVSFDANTPGSYSFTVRNTGNLQTTYTLSAACSGGVTSCSVQSSLTLASNVETYVPVSFNAGTGGTVKLHASADPQPATKDSGWVTVSAIVQAPRLAVMAPDKDRMIRAGCPTVGAGPGAAVQCGDLLYAHSFPAYRSMNKARSVTLLYNSATVRPTPTVAVDFATYAGETVPDRLKMEVHKGAVRLASAYYLPASSSGSSDQLHRLAIQIPPDSATLTTGAHEVTITVERRLSDAVLSTHTASATLLVVDRRSSPFGAGWWPAGIERLHLAQDTLGSVLLELGDGSALYFRKNGSAFTSPPGEHSSLASVSGGQFKRVMPGGRVTIWYSISGLVDSLIDNNPTPNKATYSWSGELLTSITDPVLKSVTFGYTSGRVTSIDIPHINTITLKQRSRPTNTTTFYLDTIVDPDGTKISYRYDSTSHWRMVAAKPRAHGFMNYRFDTLSATVDSVAWPAVTGLATLVSPLKVRAWQRVGASTKSAGSIATPANAKHPDSARVVIESGRGDSGWKWDTTWFRVDRSGAPIRVAKPLAGTMRIDRDSIGQPVYIQSSRGAQVWQQWSTRGQLIRSIAVGVRSPVDTTTAIRYDTTTYDYDPAWWGPTRTINAERDTTWIFYDAYGRQDSVRNGRGYTTRMQYTARGQLERITEPNAAGTGTENYPTVYTYDPTTLNLASVTDSTGTVTYTYQANASDLDKVTNAAGDYTQYGYDALKRTVRVKRGGLSTSPDSVLYAYDDVLLRRTQTDPLGGVSTWDYDAAGRLTTRCVRANWCETTDYLDARNPTRVQTRKGDYIVMAYDAAGRMTQKKLGLNGEDDVINYAYDSDGNLNWVTNKYSQITRDYDQFGRLRYEKQEIKEWMTSLKHAVEVWHSYDRAGRRKNSYLGNTVTWQRVCTPAPIDGDTLPSCIQPWALTATDSITYSYNKAGSLSRIRNTLYRLTSSQAVGLWDYTYDAKERVTQLAVPSGVSLNWTYDNDDRLTSYWKSGASGPNEVLTRDATGRVWRHQMWGGNRTDDFTYDGRGQLTTVTSAYAPDDYTYDAGGNRLTDNRWTFHYNSKGQLYEKVDGAGCWMDYSYDLNGNQIEAVWRTAPCSESTKQTMTYDKGDRMVTMEEDVDGGPNPGIRRRTFWYDGLGRRILMFSHNSIADDWGVWRYWWLEDHVVVKTRNGVDTTGSTPPLVDLWWPRITRLSNGTLEGEGEWFYYGPGTDNVLASWNWNRENDRRHLFFADYRGSIVHVTRADNTALSLTAGSYSPFGGLPSGAPAGAGSQPGYNGHEMAGGLVYMRNRWYDPNTGRFTQQDPIGFAGGINLYGYTGNNPVSYADPFGLCKTIPICLAQVIGNAGRAISSSSSTASSALSKLGSGAAKLGPVGAAVIGTAAGAGALLHSQTYGSSGPRVGVTPGGIQQDGTAVVGPTSVLEPLEKKAIGFCVVLAVCNPSGQPSTPSIGGDRNPVEVVPPPKPPKDPDEEERPPEDKKKD